MTTRYLCFLHDTAGVLPCQECFRAAQDFNPGHYHLHTQEGACYGDYADFEHALEHAAYRQADWNTPWGVPALTIIDAPICMDDCRETRNDDEEA